MSLTINSSPPLITTPPVGQQAEAVRKPPGPQLEEKQLAKENPAAKAPDFFKALEKMFAGNTHDSGKLQKSFNKLAHSLEKTFGEAPKVERETGEEEMRHGGLKRIGKDLSKMFKGLGIPKQLAKQLAHGITDAMKTDDVEQINFSLTASRAFNLEVQQLSQGYLANGDGKMVAVSSANSFQLTALQVRSFDFSLNLRSGEFSMSQSSFESISMSSSSSSSLLSNTTQSARDNNPPLPETTVAETGIPPAPAGPGSDQPSEAATTTPAPAEPTNDFAAMVQSNSQLLQISRVVQQSMLMQLKPAATNVATEADTGSQIEQGLRTLQDMTARLEELAGVQLNLFETLVNVSNLRIDDEADDQHLRFTLDALVPIGLRASNDAGRTSTLYPRPDGSLAKVVEDPVQLSV